MHPPEPTVGERLGWKADEFNICGTISVQLCIHKACGQWMVDCAWLTVARRPRADVEWCVCFYREEGAFNRRLNSCTIVTSMMPVGPHATCLYDPVARATGYLGVLHRADEALKQLATHSWPSLILASCTLSGWSFDRTIVAPPGLSVV